MVVEMISWPISTKECFAALDNRTRDCLNTKRMHILLSYLARLSLSLNLWDFYQFWKPCSELLASSFWQLCCKGTSPPVSPSPRGLGWKLLLNLFIAHTCNCLFLWGLSVLNKCKVSFFEKVWRRVPLRLPQLCTSSIISGTTADICLIERMNITLSETEIKCKTF